MTSSVHDLSRVLPCTAERLWKVVATPELVVRFLDGVGTIERTGRHREQDLGRYRIRVDTAGAPIDIDMDAVIVRSGREVRFENVAGPGLISLTLAERSPAATELIATALRATDALPELAQSKNEAILHWMGRALDRIADYIAGRPTSVLANHGSIRPAHLAVLKVMVATGVVRTTVPHRGARQLMSLARWGFTLAGGIAAAQARSPHVPAIVDDRGTLTFSELHERSSVLGAALQGRGIGRGDTVGLLARNHSAMVGVMAACGKIGADVVLCNTALAARQLEDIADRHNLSALMLDDEFDSLARGLPPEIHRFAVRQNGRLPHRLGIRDLLATATTPIAPARTPGKLIALTSGTTGLPKSATRPTPGGFGPIAAMLSRMPLRMGEPMMIAAPLFHSWGLAMLQVSTSLRAPVILPPRADPEELLRGIALHRCTSLVAVPIMLQRIMNLPAEVRDRYDTGRLRVVAISGSPPSAALVREFSEAYGNIVYNFYGSTEVSWGSVADPRDLHLAPTTAGRPPLGTSVMVADPQGRPVPVGMTGRICVGNDMLFEGYTNAAAPQSHDNLMDTGDLGWIDGSGRLYVAGRNDEMIISGGENIFPRPVEEALLTYPGIAETAVVGVNDPEYGQRLVAYLVAHEGVAVDPDELRRYLRERLSRFAVPRDFVFLRELPRTVTGKIVKRDLRRST